MTVILLTVLARTLGPGCDCHPPDCPCWVTTIVRIGLWVLGVTVSSFHCPDFNYYKKQLVIGLGFLDAVSTLGDRQPSDILGRTRQPPDCPWRFKPSRGSHSFVKLLENSPFSDWASWVRVQCCLTSRDHQDYYWDGALRVRVQC